MVSIGKLVLETGIDLSSYRRDRAKLLAEIDALAKESGAKLSKSMATGLSGAGVGYALRKEFALGTAGLDVTIRRALTKSVDGFGAELAKSIARQIQGIQLAPISAPAIAPPAVPEPSRDAGKDAGKAYGAQFAAGVPDIGGIIRNSIIQANIATAIGSSLLSGVTGAIGGVIDSLKGAIGTVLGDLGGGIRSTIADNSVANQFKKGMTEESQTINMQAAISSIGGVDWKAAGASSKRLKSELAKVASAQAGSNSDYQEFMAGISDDMIKGFTGKDQKFDETELARFEKSAVKISQNVGNIAANSGRGQASWNGAMTAISKLMNGGTFQDLRSDDFFQRDGKEAFAYLESKTKIAGGSQFSDLDKASQVQLLEEAMGQGFSAERAAASAGTADSQIQSIISQLFDASEGKFSIRRSLAQDDKGNDLSVMESMKNTIQETANFFTQLGVAAESAGLKMGDPMVFLNSMVVTLNATIVSAAQNLQAFFATAQGQALADSINQAGAALGQMFTSLVAALPSILLAVTEIGTVLITTIADAIPVMVAGIVQFSEYLAQNPAVIGEFVSGVSNLIVGIYEFGLGVASALSTMAQMAEPIITIVAQLFGATEGSTSFARSLGEAVTWIGAIGLGMGVVSTVIGIISPIIAGISSVFGTIASICSVVAGWVGAIGALLTGPIILGVTAAAIWVMNIVNYSKNWNDVCLGIKQTWIDLLSWVNKVTGGLLNNITQSKFVQAAATGISNTWTAITTTITNGVKFVGNFLMGLSPVKTMVDGIKAGWGGFVDGIVQAVAKFTPFADQVMGLWRMISGGGQQQGGGMGDGKNAFFGVNNEADLYRLAVVAMTEGKAGNLDSQVDSAVSIGNRVQAGKWGGDASKVVSAQGQYEAWTRFGLQSVSDRASAIEALKRNGRGEKDLDAFLNALNDKTKVMNSIEHLKGSTDYRAYVEGVTERAGAGDPQRSSDDNYYLPGGTRQASVSAQEAGNLYAKGRSMISAAPEGQSFTVGGGEVGGQTIGISGNTGGSTGAHIHLQREDKQKPTADDIAQFMVNGQPLSSYPVSSDYGPRGGGMHSGIDFAVAEGGKVTMANNSKPVQFVEQVDEKSGKTGTGGNMTVVDFKDGNTLKMMHMAEQSLSVGNLGTPDARAAGATSSKPFATPSFSGGNYSMPAFNGGGGQKHVIIPLDHVRGMIPDKTGGNTYKASGQTGAAYRGFTERDYQDPLAAKAKTMLQSQGYKVTIMRPEDFRSFEEYDSKIAQYANQGGIVTPLHLDAKGGSYLTRSKAGDGADNQLSQAIYSGMQRAIGGNASSKFTGMDTEANMTINAAGNAPATLVEFGEMSAMIDRYKNPQGWIRSQEAQKALEGYITGLNQFTGGAKKAAGAAGRSASTIAGTPAYTPTQIAAAAAPADPTAALDTSPEGIRSRLKLENTSEKDLAELKEKDTLRAAKRQKEDDDRKTKQRSDQLKFEKDQSALSIRKEDAPLKATNAAIFANKKALESYDQISEELKRKDEDVVRKQAEKAIALGKMRKELEKNDPNFKGTDKQLLTDPQYVQDRAKAGVNITDFASIRKDIAAQKKLLQEERSLLEAKGQNEILGNVETNKDALDAQIKAVDDLNNRYGNTSSLRKHLLALREIDDNYTKKSTELPSLIKAMRESLAASNLAPAEKAKLEAQIKEAQSQLDGLGANKLTAIARVKLEFDQDEKKKFDGLLREMTSLDQGDDAQTAQSKFDKAVADRKLKYDDLNRKVKDQLDNYAESMKIEGLSAEMKDSLTASYNRLSLAQIDLNKAQIDGAKAMERQLDLDRQKEAMQARGEALGYRVGILKEEAAAIEKYNPLLSTELNRRAAMMDMVIKYNAKLLEIKQRAETRRKQLGTETGRQLLRDSGIGASESGIQEQQKIETQALGAQGNAELRAIQSKFPTVTQELREQSRKAFSDGLSKGLMSFLKGGKFDLGEFAASITDLFLKKGVEMLTQGATNALFGGSEEDKGALGAMESASIIDEGTMKAADNLISGAQSAAQILAGATMGMTQNAMGMPIAPSTMFPGGASPMPASSLFSPFEMANRFQQFMQPQEGTIVPGGASPLPPVEPANLLLGADGALNVGTMISEDFVKAAENSDLGVKAGGLFAGSAGQGLQGVIGGVSKLFSGKGKFGFGDLLGLATSAFSAFGGKGKVATKASGGPIERANFDVLRNMPGDPFSLRREGPNSVLIAATPGEYMLTPPEARSYLSMGGLSGMVQNFSEGGMVQGAGGGNLSIPVSQQATAPQTIKLEMQAINGVNYASEQQLQAMEARINSRNDPQRAVDMVQRGFRGSPSFRRNAGF